MATTQIKFNEVVYPLFGIAAYWAWSSSVMITAGIWPERMPDPYQIDWMANVIAHGTTLLVLSFFLCQLQSLIQKRLWGFASAVLIVLGTVLVLINNLTIFSIDTSVLGSVVSGIGCGGALVYWASALMAIEQPEVKRIIISGSVVVGLVVTVLFICLPFQFGTCVCVVLPFALLLCSRINRNDDVKAVENTTTPLTPKKRFWSQVSLYLCCFILALAAGMYQIASAQDVLANTIDQWRMLHASVFMFVSIALYLDYRLQATHMAALFSQLIVPLIAGGLLIVSVVGGGFGGWGGVIMHTGYQLFLVYIYTEFALKEDISSKRLMVFVRGTISIDVGLIGGFFFMMLTGVVGDIDLRNVSLAVVYLLLLVGVLLFPSVIANVVQRTNRLRFVVSGHDEQMGIRSMFGAEQSVNAAGAYADARSAQLLGAFAAQHSLSPREVEILEYLLRGRTLPAIAEDAHLSYNTVKTHVSHIYQKIGVHTRDEMIDALETWFSEQMK